MSSGDYDSAQSSREALEAAKTILEET